MSHYEKRVITNPLNYWRYFYYYPERYGGKDQSQKKDPWEIGVTCSLRNASAEMQITSDSKLLLRNLDVPMNVSLIPKTIKEILKSDKGDNDIVQKMNVKDI